MGSVRRVITLIAVLTLVIAACGDDTTTTEATKAPTTSAAATTTAAPTTTTAAPTTTTAPEAAGPPELPPTGVIGVIDQTYKWGDEQGTATQDELPFPIGGVEAHWYRAGDFLAVVYVGLDLEQTGPLCPGNSILGEDGFLHGTNSPSPGASCEGTGATIIGPPEGTMVCEGRVSYLTRIPSDLMGFLYASIEVYAGTGTDYGATGIAEADPDYMAEIDLALLSCD